MTVRELIEALKKMPQDDEVRVVRAGDPVPGGTPVEYAYHASAYGQDYVVIN